MSIKYYATCSFGPIITSFSEHTTLSKQNLWLPCRQCLCAYHFVDHISCASANNWYCRLILILRGNEYSEKETHSQYKSCEKLLETLIFSETFCIGEKNYIVEGDVLDMQVESVLKLWTTSSYHRSLRPSQFCTSWITLYNNLNQFKTVHPLHALGKDVFLFHRLWM